MPTTTARTPAPSATAPARTAIVIRSTAAEDLGRLVLRLSLGVLILMHGIHKLIHGVQGIGGMLERQGLPPEFAYAALVGEVLAPLLVIVGAWTRPAALLIAINMVVAIWLAHAQQLLLLTPQGGWALELQGMYLFGAIAVALLGAGRYSIAGANARLN